MRVYGRSKTTPRALVLVVAACSIAACEQRGEPALPTPAQVASHYSYQGGVHAALNGNVAEITVPQPAAQLQRGGSLWAKVGPYVLLFSDETRKLLDDYPALAGVRVITTTGGGTEVARALLSRTELSDIQWRRALNIAGRARKNGTARPALLDDLVRWGEQHTEYEYSKRYVGSG